MAENVNIKIKIDGQEASFAISELNKNLEQFSESLKGVDDGSEEFIKLTEIIAKLQSAINNLTLDVDTTTFEANVAVINDSLAELKSFAAEPTQFDVSAEQTISVTIDDQEATFKISELRAQLDLFTAQLANLDNGSQEFIQLSETVDTLRGALDSLDVTINTDAAAGDIQVVTDSLRELQILSTEPTELEIDTETSQENVEALNTEIESTQEVAKEPTDLNLTTEAGQLSLRELKAELRTVQDTAAEAGFGTPEFEEATRRAGELKDQIQDVNEAINAQTGEPIERLGSQFRGIGESLSKLNFKKATEQLDTFKNTAGEINLGELSKSALEFGKNLGGSVLSGLKAVGKAILSNPLLLLASVVIGIGTALFALKDKFEIVQVAIDKITTGVEFLVGGLKDFSDAIGLSNFAEQENLEKTTKAFEKTTKAYEDKAKAADKATKQEIALANARGASAEEIAEIETRALEKSKEAAQQYIDDNQSKLTSLQEKVDRNGELTADEIKQYDAIKAAIEDLGNANDGLKVKEAERQFSASEGAAKALQEQRQYLQQLETLQEKYTLSEEERIKRRFDKELALIKGNSEKELTIRAAIEAEKTLALNNTAEKNKQVSENIILKQAELDKKAALGLASNLEERVRIEEAFANKELLITLDRLERKKELDLANTKLTEDERKLIEAQYLLDKSAAETTASDASLNRRKEVLAKEEEALKESLDKQLDILEDARDEILDNEGRPFTLFNLKAGTDAIKQNAADQIAALTKAQEDGILLLQQSGLTKEDFAAAEIKLKEDTAKKIKDIETKSAEDSSDLALKAFTNTINSIQTGLSIINDISNTQLEDERSKLDEQQSLLDESYAARKEVIEDTITDETKKEEALSALDAEFAGKQKVLDAQDLELKKKQIRRDRNAAIAQIALSNAIAIAGTLKSAASSFNPVAFFTILATTLAAVGITIAKANTALRDAETAASALGAGGGSTPGGSDSSVGGGLPPTPPPQPVTPNTGTASGINPETQTFQGESQGITINPVVSVIDINAAQDRVNVSETRNTIGPQ